MLCMTNGMDILEMGINVAGIYAKGFSEISFETHEIRWAKVVINICSNFLTDIDLRFSWMYYKIIKLNQFL